MPIQLLLSEDLGLTAKICTSDSQTFSIPLPRGLVERTLENIFLHLHSGLAPQKIVNHFADHKHADPQCPCCKLEGRILTSSGRRPVSEADRLIAARAHSGGTVQVRHIKPNLSGAQWLAHDKRLRAIEKALSKPQYPEPVKFVKTPIEELI